MAILQDHTVNDLTSVLYVSPQELAVIRDLIRDADDVAPHWFGPLDVQTVSSLNQDLNGDDNAE